MTKSPLLHRNTLASRVPPSLLHGVSKWPRIIPPSSNRGAKRPVGGEAKGDAYEAAANDFPGALGDRINIPASVRAVLRPHQREGIAFLWNFVTGTNEGLKRAVRESVATASNDPWDDEAEERGPSKRGEDPRGAVLADKMGLRKVRTSCAALSCCNFFNRVFCTHKFSQ